MQNQTDMATQFTQAFYGGSVPDSQVLAASHDVVRVAMMMRTDIRNKVKDATDAVLDEACLVGLNMLHRLGAHSPDEYRAKQQGEASRTGIRAFQYAVAKAQEMMVQVRQSAEDAEKSAWRAELLPIREEVFGLFDRYHQQAIANESKEPKVEAWLQLVDRDVPHMDLGGYRYYLVNMGIPMEYGIYDHPVVIAVCNENPRLMDRKVTQMQVGGSAWQGIRGRK